MVYVISKENKVFSEEDLRMIEYLTGVTLVPVMDSIPFFRSEAEYFVEKYINEHTDMSFEGIDFDPLIGLIADEFMTDDELYMGGDGANSLAMRLIADFLKEVS